LNYAWLRRKSGVVLAKF